MVEDGWPFVFITVVVSILQISLYTLKHYSIPICIYSIDTNINVVWKCNSSVLQCYIHKLNVIKKNQFCSNIFGYELFLTKDQPNFYEEQRRSWELFDTLRGHMFPLVKIIFFYYCSLSLSTNGVIHIHKTKQAVVSETIKKIKPPSAEELMDFSFRFRFISSPWIIIDDIGQVNYYTITHYNKNVRLK
jgi:hypothetical protein